MLGLGDSEKEFITELKKKFLDIHKKSREDWKIRTSLSLDLFEWLKDRLPWTEEEKKILSPQTKDEMLSQEEKRKHRRWYKLWGKE